MGQWPNGRSAPILWNVHRHTVVGKLRHCRASNCRTFIFLFADYIFVVYADDAQCIHALAHGRRVRLMVVVMVVSYRVCLIDEEHCIMYLLVHCRLGQHIIFNVVLLHWMHRDGTGTRIACAMCIEIELCGNRVLRVDSNSVHGCIHRRTLEQFYLSESIFGMNSLKLGVQTKRMTGRDAGMQWMSCAIFSFFSLYS